MKKLDAGNANFAVVKTAFHGGGVITYHVSLNSAIKSARVFRADSCNCGCCAVVPITEAARQEMKTAEDELLYKQGVFTSLLQSDLLLNDLPKVENNMPPSTICL